MVLGSGVVSAAPRIAQPLLGGYAMMTELFGGQGDKGTVAPSADFVQFHQNMVAVHSAMLRYSGDTFGTRGIVGPYMGGAYSQSSQGNVGYGYMMGGY